MIGYMTVGTKDLKKSGEFNDKICGELGMGRFMANRRLDRLGRKRPGRRFRRLPALRRQVDDGGQWRDGGLSAPRTRSRSIAFTSLRWSLGGTCEGPPGTTQPANFYAAYFRDPDGNKLNAFVMG